MAKEVIVSKKYINGMVAKLKAESPEKLTHFVGRALVIVFKNQTDAERNANVTNVDNGIGFAGGDAYSGCLTAKSYLKSKTLQDWQIEKWIKPNKKGDVRLSKYWKQINEAAMIKKAQENS